MSQNDQRPNPGIRHMRKRLKVAIACHNCRKKKLKCDGLAPGMLAKSLAWIWAGDSSIEFVWQAP